MDAAITKTNPLGTERIGKLIVTFAVPGIISMVVNACTTLLTRFYWAGVGYLGNGATNVVMPMTVMAIALSILIGDGAAAYLSLKLGDGDEKSAARGVGCSISVMAVTGIVLCILFNLFWNRCAGCLVQQKISCLMQWIMEGLFLMAFCFLLLILAWRA